jgi:hypothetical protein
VIVILLPIFLALCLLDVVVHVALGYGPTDEA